eukprot:gene37471-46226_t
MVKDISNITPEEREVIDVFDKVCKRHAKELSTNKTRRLINKPSGGIHSAGFTAPDDLRRALSITFGSSVKSLQILVDHFVQQFIDLGLVHPDTVATNALGKRGIEMLFKGKGCVEDHLNRPDGTHFTLPPYSYCILRGNVAHGGTGNSEDKPVFKFFCYLDPVEYYRSTNKYKDSVFLFNEYRHIVRAVKSPHDVVLNKPIMPYYCIYCSELFHYTYPMCTKCLSSKWKLKLRVDKTTQSHFVCTNSGRVPLKAGHTFPAPFPKGIIARTEFDRMHPVIKGEPLAHIPVGDGAYVVDLLGYKYFLACVKMQSEGFNAELERSEDNAEGGFYLKVVKDIAVKGELILKAEPCFVSNNFLVDIDEYALKAVLEGGDDERMIVRAVPHAENAEVQVEIDGEDGESYDEDEEYDDYSEDDDVGGDEDGEN